MFSPSQSAFNNQLGRNIMADSQLHLAPLPEEFFSVSIHDEVLRKNFGIVVSNFKLIQKRFGMGEERVMRTLNNYIVQNKFTKQDLNNRIDNLVAKLFSLERLISVMENKMAEVCLSIAENEAKWIDYQNFKKLQTKYNEWDKQKNQSTKNQLNELTKAHTRIEEMFPKKCDKSQFEKLKKELSNLAVKTQLEHKKVEEATHESNRVAKELQGVNASILELKEKVANQQAILVDQLLVQVKGKVLSQNPKEEVSHKKQNLSQEVSAHQNSQQLTRHFNQLDELKIKVEKLIEYEKNREKQSRLQPVVRFSKQQHKSDSSSKAELQNINKLLKTQLDSLQQKFSLMERKQQNYRFLVQTAEEKVCYQSNKLIESKTKALQEQIYTQTKLLLKRVESKIDCQEYFLQVKEETKKRQMVVSQLNQKANIADVKKALQFLERQFRELVSTVHDGSEGDRDMVASRLKLLKCLSCDKELQTPGARVQLRKRYLQSRNKVSSEIRRAKTRQTFKL